MTPLMLILLAGGGYAIYRFRKPVDKSAAGNAVSTTPRPESKPDFEYKGNGCYIGAHVVEQILVLEGTRPLGATSNARFVGSLPFSDIRTWGKFSTRGFFVSRQGIEFQIKNTNFPIVRVIMGNNARDIWLPRISQLFENAGQTVSRR